jgi:hypothetical protein
MGTNIRRRYIGNGMIAIRVNDGDEFEVHQSVWNDANSIRSIIAGEIESQGQMRELPPTSMLGAMADFVWAVDGCPRV